MCVGACVFLPVSSIDPMTAITELYCTAESPCMHQNVTLINPLSTGVLEATFPRCIFSTTTAEHWSVTTLPHCNLAAIGSWHVRHLVTSSRRTGTIQRWQVNDLSLCYRLASPTTTTSEQGCEAWEYGIACEWEAPLCTASRRFQTRPASWATEWLPILVLEHSKCKA